MKCSALTFLEMGFFPRCDGSLIQIRYLPWYGKF